MLQNEEQRLKCPEHFESPIKRAFHSSNPMIKLDIANKKSPYFCCNFHEEEFQGEFQSEEETMAINDEFEGIVFLNCDPEVDLKPMQFRDEVGVQCSGGVPVSLKYLSTLPAECKDAKEITIKASNRPTLHEPLVILPREDQSFSFEDEDDGCFQCKFCFKIFITGQALGGHMSRKHPVVR